MYAPHLIELSETITLPNRIRILTPEKPALRRRCVDMKSITIALLLGVGSVVLLPMPDVEAAVSSGTVIRRISGCDYFMVQTRTDYAILEWYGGHDPDKDDVLVGAFNSYGFHTYIYRNDEDRTSRLYVEDYGLNKEDALEKLIDRCE